MIAAGKSPGRLHRATTFRRTLTSAVALAAVVTTAAPGVAAAIEPPAVDPGALPGAGEPAPMGATEQRNLCTEASSLADGPGVPPAMAAMDFPSAWQFTRGAGQVVAVIDTGVARHPRLPDLQPGGDYVSTGDGTDDCDAHGTLVAGLIGARTAPGSGFAGGAPDARILSIRQSSANFSERGVDRDADDPANSSGYGNVRTMAAAIRRAVDLGATVVNVSEVACRPAHEGMNDADVGAAVRYAADRDVVVVAAAGNVTGDCRSSNPATVDPLDPGGDPWSSVTTVASPAWYDDDVLTVGSVQPDGSPAQDTLPGPWVDVAAPGTGVVSLHPRDDGLTDAFAGRDGEVSIAGTSFAAPLVAATAALVRARYPQLTAREVAERIEATAHSPAEGWNPVVGHGVVDPVAAVTAPLRPAPPTEPATVSVAAPVPEPRTDRRPRIFAAVVSAVVLALGVAVAAGTALVRRHQS